MEVQESGAATYQPGLYWHVHHVDDLVEYCWSYQERADFIRTLKREEEQALRLRLFQPVRGPLPPAVGEALSVLHKARQACIEAWPASDSARQDHDEALQAYNKTLRDNMPAIEALHAKECPDCPWDGNTIFSA